MTASDRARILAEARRHAGIAIVWMSASKDAHDDRQAYLRAKYALRLACRARPGLRGDR